MGNVQQEKETVLTKDCLLAKKTACDFIAWSEQFVDVVGQDRHTIRKELNRTALQMERLARAAARPMGVAVFGPSQAGKSYLISALARKGTTPLMAKFGQRSVDFLQEINPAGGKESTGIVTRFTIRHTPSPHPDFPVVARLLDQLDIIKILANSFFADLDPGSIPELEVDEVTRALEHAQSAAQENPVDGLTEAMVYDLHDYLMRGFRGINRLRSLTDEYWDSCAELLPRLNIDDRANLIAVLWAGNRAFTDLYVRLYTGLKCLDFSKEVYAPLETKSDTTRGALIPRGSSVIDVSALQGLDESNVETLTVRGSSGAEKSIARCDFAALIAELVIEMEEKAYDYFEHTDLLDFPGYRSREQIRNLDDFLYQPQGIESLFLRGKVAYLFQRYREERDLTSMLLCIADSNQEVKSLPEVVNDWISDTHGDTPEQRNGHPVSLFLVLTKFDKEFDEKEGVGQKEEDYINQWENRLHSSLWSFLGQQHSWPDTWDLSGAFRNSFWIRNPTYKAKHLFEYREDGSETQLVTAPRELERIEKLKKGFLGNPKATRNFSDPELAWNSALKPNDGGISYLADSLGQVCNSNLKYTQLLKQYRYHLAEMKSRVAEYYVSDDKTLMVEQRVNASRRVASALIQCSNIQRFGLLLKKIQISEAFLMELYYKLDSDISQEQAVVVEGEHAPDDDLHAMLGLDPVQFGETDLSMEDQPRVKSFAELFADEVMATWISNLHDLAGDLAVQRYFFLPGGTMLDLVKELKAGAQRLAIEQRVVTAVDEATRLRMDIHNTVAYPARRTAQIINDYINYLGFDLEPPENRPKLKGVAIFESPEEIAGLPQLSESPKSFELKYTASWLQAFLSMVKINAASGTGTMINTEANEVLGSLIKRIDKVAA